MTDAERPEWSEPRAGGGATMNAQTLLVPAVLAAFLSMTVSVSAEPKCRFGDTPLPEDIRLPEPIPGAEDAVNLVGVWVGAWRIRRGHYQRCHTLVVKSVNPLEFTYSWGDSPKTGKKGGFNEDVLAEGKIKRDQNGAWTLDIILYSTDSAIRKRAFRWEFARVVYTLVSPDFLMGRYQRWGYSGWTLGDFERTRPKQTGMGTSGE